jgi:hypothetical protein
MKKIILLIGLFSIAAFAQAQSTIEVNLRQWKGKQQNIPFTIDEIADNRVDTKRIGVLKISKTKEKTVEFVSSSQTQVQEFLSKNFKQEKGLNVRMEIDRLDIQEITVKKKKMNALYYECKFYKNDNSLNVPLYTFKARNTIPKKNALTQALTNYVGRAITAGVANFKRSYKKHPEWKKENVNSPTVAVQKSIVYNELGGGDTIALDGKYNLTAGDFAGAVGEEEKDDAFSHLMMTYKIQAEDNTKKISLKIFPKAYFLRSASWSKKKDSTNWLSHQQLLFDLASYHGQLFKKALEEKEFSAGYYKTEANAIYNSISANYFDEMDQLQAETKYGEEAEKEAAWRTKIDKYLGK